MSIIRRGWRGADRFSTLVVPRAWPKVKGGKRSVVPEGRTKVGGKGVDVKGTWCQGTGLKRVKRGGNAECKWKSLVWRMGDVKTGEVGKKKREGRLQKSTLVAPRCGACAVEAKDSNPYGAER